MPYLSLEDFKLGLDTRRMAATSPAGSLLEAKNVVINRGNEIEVAKKFVEEVTLPAGTFGYAQDAGEQYVFGSAAAPVGLPAGFTYQRLQHPDGLAMTRVVQAGPVLDGMFVIAEYSDGRRLPFFNAALITDFTDGVVRSSMLNNAGVASHLAGVVDADADYAAAAASNVVTITGPAGRPFSIAGRAVNGGAVDNQALTVATTVLSVPAVSEVAPKGTIRVVGGSENPGVNRIAAVTVNGVSITTSDVDWTATNEATATALANEINSSVSSPDYRATVSGDTVTISAASGVGTGANGFAVQTTVAGDVVVGTGGFTVSGSATGNTCTSVSIGGSANILSGTVNWVTDDSAFAAAIAANIAANSATSGYTAVADGPIIRIGRLVTTGTLPKNLAVTTAGTGATTYTTSAAAVNSGTTNMTGGVDAFAGVSQQSTVTVGGTFDVGDKFTISANDAVRGDIVWGAGNVAGSSPTTFLGADNKVYVAAQQIVAASAIADATRWNSDDAGTWLKDIASELTEMGDVVSIMEYQKRLAFSGESGTVIYDTDPDPSLNQIFQKIPRTGSKAALSATAYLDSDSFYLSGTGIRSLRSKDSSNVAVANDVGSSIDELILTALASLSSTAVSRAFSAIEPTDGRYMLYLGGTVYVFSFFPNAKVSAWTTIVPGVELTEFAVVNGQLKARGGNKIYCYGGAAGTTYMSAADDVQFTLPFINARKIATWKKWGELDWAVEGEWDLFICTDPNQPSEEFEAATLFEISFSRPNTVIPAESPMLKCRFVRADNATIKARLSNFTMHYVEHRT